jgi:hypothetical protein
MARGTRRGLRVFSGLFSPISHILRAGKKSVGAVTNAAKGVVGKGINGVERLGRGVTSEMNAAVGNLGRRLTRKSRKGGRRTRKNRKGKGTRRNRKH